MEQYIAEMVCVRRARGHRSVVRYESLPSSVKYLEVVDGETGFLVDVGAADLLAAGLLVLLSRRDRWPAWGIPTMRFADRQRWPGFLRQFRRPG
jgi:hypothetical protein